MPLCIVVSDEACGLQNLIDQFDSDTMLQYAPVSQLKDYPATNRSVAGLSPVRSTKYAACPGGEGAVLKTVGQ